MGLAKCFVMFVPGSTLDFQSGFAFDTCCSKTTKCRLFLIYISSLWSKDINLATFTAKLVQFRDHLSISYFLIFP